MRFKKDLPQAGSGSTSYLKLKDKESVVGVFQGMPHEFYATFKDGKYVEEPGGKFRFKINFVIKEGTTFVPKIFEQGQVVYEQLGALHDEYGLDSVTVKITRRGEKLDTSYDILPLRGEISAETKAVLKSIKLHDFGNGGHDDTPFPTEFHGPPDGDNDELPF